MSCLWIGSFYHAYDCITSSNDIPGERGVALKSIILSDLFTGSLFFTLLRQTHLLFLFIEELALGGICIYLDACHCFSKVSHYHV
uniref:Uncharacterized protein n=1 Tax=Picea glauca TaxID=3330 RepID=A0A101LXI7_PICGL|nr:hypothetical protein ABT39_MTgene6192 [Picea glauca]QHR88712.1 hypothetical protein Q903MT_gene2726 [Picea sitchensis]